MLNAHSPDYTHRRKVYARCFSTKKMDSVWKDYVRNGLRKQTILDLHDYYDFHRNRKDLFNSIRKEIELGLYKPQTPLMARTEKKLGVCRHILIPRPEDAIVLQTLVEKIMGTIKKKQPTDRAYYSRSHVPYRKESDIDETFPYEWWELWPEFQERIYHFSSTFQYVVVTDIANYFDCISLARLRSVIASYGKIEEAVLDLLFYVLDSQNWQPDYLPSKGIGLPQINFDAPRLLAHGFLYSVDKYLSERTQDNFVRWMDDIDFGVNEYDKAKRILKDLDEVLLTKGLRLNLGKTSILTGREAKDYFLPDENRYLTILTNRIERYLIRRLNNCDNVKQLKNRFKGFLKRNKAGRWEKVYARYFTIASLCGDDFLCKKTLQLLTNFPGLRRSIFKYFTSLGYSRGRFNQLRDFIMGPDSTDDVCVFYACKTIVDWHIKPKRSVIKDIISLVNWLSENKGGCFISSLWLLAKYGTEDALYKLVRVRIPIWLHSDFMSRQVSALIPIFRKQTEHYNFIVESLAKAGKDEALKVVQNLNDLRKRPLSSADRMYICHGKGEVRTYPLGKYLIALDILSSDDTSANYRDELRKDLIERIPDPVYTANLMEIEI